MDDKLSKIIQLVEKLLAYDENNSTPGELEAAQRKAQELITKYQIEEAQLFSADGRDIIDRKVNIDKPYALDKMVLVNTIAKRNFCKVLRGKDYVRIYGYESDIELVLVLYQMLLAHMIGELHSKLEHSSDHSKGWKTSFFAGYAAEIGERLDQAKKQQMQQLRSTGTDLVVRDKQMSIEKYWDRLPKGDSNARVVSSSDGYSSGQSSGSRADLGQTKLRGTPELNR